MARCAGVFYFFLAALFFDAVLCAEDAVRRRPLDLRIVVDASLSLKNGKQGAVNWLCGPVVDEILQTGDYFLLVVSRENDETVFDGIITNDAQKTEIKDKIRAMGEPAGLSYAGKTLRDIAARRGAADGIPVLMLACGSDIRVDGGLLKYSRTEYFAYWRVITIGLNIEAAIETALKKAM